MPLDREETIFKLRALVIDGQVERVYSIEAMQSDPMEPAFRVDTIHWKLYCQWWYQWIATQTPDSDEQNLYPHKILSQEWLMLDDGA